MPDTTTAGRFVSSAEDPANDPPHALMNAAPPSTAPSSSSSDAPAPASLISPSAPTEELSHSTDDANGKAMMEPLKQLLGIDMPVQAFIGISAVLVHTADQKQLGQQQQQQQQQLLQEDVATDGSSALRTLQNGAGGLSTTMAMLSSPSLMSTLSSLDDQALDQIIDRATTTGLAQMSASTSGDAGQCVARADVTDPTQVKERCSIGAELGPHIVNQMLAVAGTLVKDFDFSKVSMAASRVLGAALAGQGICNCELGTARQAMALALTSDPLESVTSVDPVVDPQAWKAQ